MNTSLKGLKNFSLLILVLFSLSACNPTPDPDFEQGNGQQIFEVWQLNEIIRKGCDDANNNFRRPCTECHTLVMNTDNSYWVENEDKALVLQGNFRIVNDTDIIFDPGIFTTDGVSSVTYSLFKGALKFDYTDNETDCVVTEAYVVKGNSVSGD